MQLPLSHLFGFQAVLLLPKRDRGLLRIVFEPVRSFRLLLSDWLSPARMLFLPNQAVEPK